MTVEGEGKKLLNGDATGGGLQCQAGLVTACYRAPGGVGMAKVAGRLSLA